MAIDLSGLNGLFETVGELAESGFGFGSTYVTAQANQNIAQANNQRGVSSVTGGGTTIPVYIPTGPQQPQAAPTNYTPWLIGGGILFLLLLVGLGIYAFTQKGK